MVIPIFVSWDQYSWNACHARSWPDVCGSVLQKLEQKCSFNNPKLPDTTHNMDIAIVNQKGKSMYIGKKSLKKFYIYMFNRTP